MSANQMAQPMDGTSLAERIVVGVAARAAEISRRTGTSPCLATVLVGYDPASATYGPMKRARCAKAGINSRHIGLSATSAGHEARECEAYRGEGMHRDPVHILLRRDGLKGRTLVDVRAAGVLEQDAVHFRIAGQVREGADQFRGCRDSRQTGRDAPARQARDGDVLPLAHR